MRSNDHRTAPFDLGGATSQRSTAPGKRTRTQTLGFPATDHGVSENAFEGESRRVGGSAPRADQSYVDEILSEGASQRVDDWHADDALLSAMGLGSEEASPAIGRGLDSHALSTDHRSQTSPATTNHGLRASSAVASTARPARARSTRPVHPTTYLKLGSQDLRVVAGILLHGDDELGEVEDASAVLGKLARTAPTSIVFRPKEGVTSPAAGDLIAGASDGSRVTVNSVVWVRSEGRWEKLKGERSRGGGSFKGFTKSGGGSVRERLTEMTRAGQLQLTGSQIAAMEAIAAVETGSQIGCVQTSDDQVVSVGFKQVVLGHGSLERVMRAAPAGFARHGLALDDAKTYVKSDWRNTPHQIVGCEDVEALRTPEWAIKFYYASLEPDVIAAICQEALVDLRRVETATASQANPTGENFFEDPVAVGWLLEVYNNRPAFMAKTIARVDASTATSREEFLDLLETAIIETYVIEEPLVAYAKAKKAFRASNHNQNMSAAADAELLAAMKRQYEPVGRTKGTNIVSKIPRTLAPADLSPGNTTEATPRTPSPVNSPTPQSVRSPSQAPTLRVPIATVVGHGASPGHDEAHPNTEPTDHVSPSTGTRSTASASADVPSSRRMRVTAARLNVRNAPSTSSAVVGSLHRGDVVEGSFAQEHWLAIQFQARPAYVHRDHLEATGAPAPVAAVAPPQGSFGIDDALTGIMPATVGLANAMGSGLAWLAGGTSPGGVRQPASPVAGVGAAQPARPRVARAPEPALPVSAVGDAAIEGLVAQIGTAEVSSVASDLAGLKSRSAALTRNRQEERGEGRDHLVEDIGALRAKLAALQGGDAAVDSFKAAVYRSILDLAPFYYQSRNIDVLESPPATQTRTCNVTVLGMALESLGKSPSAFTGHRNSLLAAARIYQSKIMGDDVSLAAEDMTAGRGTSWDHLVGMRFPDFLELAAIAREARGATDDEAVKAAAVAAWDSILDWQSLRNLAGDFGVTATTKLFDASGIRANRQTGTRTDDQVIRSHGNRNRMPVEHYINARNSAASGGRNPERAAANAERLRPAYEEAVADTAIDERVSLETYRQHLLDQVGRDLNAGSAVIVGLSNHFVRLQSLKEDHIIVDDPARDTRSATSLTYAEARAMGYFHMRFVLS